MLKEFKQFALRGNVIDMAVGIIVGGAFGTIVRSLVSDVVMPPIGVLIGNVDFSNLFLVIKNGKTPPPYGTLAAAKAAGAVTMNYGVFFNDIVSFLIVAAAVFILVRSINRLEREIGEPTPPTTKVCAYCYSAIPIKAVRCPQCTSDLKESSEKPA
ncbi:MAG: large conductance mechanosensitive channel protein MscL [Nitrospirota bacterium]